eukprot:722090-Hanusia_phi.AAC.1
MAGHRFVVQCRKALILQERKHQILRVVRSSASHCGCSSKFECHHAPRDHGVERWEEDYCWQNAGSA